MGFKEELADAGKLVCFQLVYYLVKCIPSKAKKKRLLLVKTDEIGDYVLVRNFLGKFRESPLFRDHQITLIGNAGYRQLFEAYDAGVVDETIWLDKIRFRRNMIYRFSILRKVRKAGFTDAVNLVYTRSFRADDLLIAVSTAGKKIGMKNEYPPESRVERMLTPRRIYHQLLDPGQESSFDAYKNALFIGKLLQTRINAVSISMRVLADASRFSLPPAYFIIFPGSGNKEKIWPVSYFCEVARFVSDTYGIKTVVCGSNGDKAEAEQFIAAFGRPAIDLTGRTSLPEFLAVLKSAKCLISVDTGSVHLAAAVGCRVYGLYNGLHYGRFGPYPVELARHFTSIYPDEIDEKIQENHSFDSNKIALNLISKIPPAKVIDRIKESFTLTSPGGSPPGQEDDHPGFQII